jgi:hypothetical protein
MQPKVLNENSSVLFFALEVYSFFIHIGFHGASYFSTFGSRGVSELSGKFMIVASDVSSAQAY